MTTPDSSTSRENAGETAYDSDPRLPILQYMGLRIVSVSTELAEVEVQLRDDLRNSGGMLQGGLTATLVDVAGGLVASRAADRRPMVTSDMNVHYLTPARVGPIRAVATILRQGRRSIVSEVRVYDAGDDSRLVAAGTMTMTLMQA